VESTLVKLTRKSKPIFKDHHLVSCVSLYLIVASKSTKDMFMCWSKLPYKWVLLEFYCFPSRSEAILESGEPSSTKRNPANA
jgi:hypothetical protein